jgi:glyoxylase-like metal-dependent hydrolase (beta-lactamase superfamily II)/8-oxo-dGTP pyrophosphatase MutT (NUDIX family)
MSAALRPAASVIAIHRGPPLELLWVRRSEANPFLGGFHSFPGGRHTREDGRLDEGEENALRAMARCAARETFEETGLLIGFLGDPPAGEAEGVRRDVLDGKAEFWPAVERWGLKFDPSVYVPSGRWITPPFSRARFNTNFFLVHVAERSAPDVWPGELESGEWIEPRRALALWEEDRVVLAMPTLHAIQVLAEGGHNLPARLHAIPEANGVPSRHVHVRPAITMIPLKAETLLPATHTNAVVIGDGDVIICDPGSADPEELDALYRVVDEALAPGRKPIAILLTHRHRDHLAGVEAVRARDGTPVWAHPLVTDRVRLDRELREGDTIEVPGRHPRRVRVLETPGHARSHLAFHEETSNTLVAGDLISGLGTVVIDPPDGNMRDYVESLKRLQGMGLRTLIPGHGPPNRGVDRALEALIEHRRMREGRILRELAQRPLDERELLSRVYSDTPGAAPELAAKTLRAHLEKLVAEGRVRAKDGRLEKVAARPGEGHE